MADIIDELLAKKLPEKLVKEIAGELLVERGDTFVDRLKCGNCKYRNKKEGYCELKPKLNERGQVTEKYAKVGVDSIGCADFDEEEEKEEELKEIYRTLIDILKEWCDMKEEYYALVALWIIGTYYHDKFFTYPFLFFNAMKGSGKTRILKLITHLSKEGVILNSLREAELFRSKGTLAIDEFENAIRKGIENLRELLNSAYKKGTKVRRMKKVQTRQGEEYQVEEFDVYRPIVMANINGMENVLDDRCIKIILEKSENKCIVNMIEVFDLNKKIIEVKELLKEKCIECSVELSTDIYLKWNNYINNNINNNTIHYTRIHSTHETLFKKIKNIGINGRELELSFPLILLAEMAGDTDTILKSLKKIMLERREEHNIENWDISLLDFLSQEPENDYFQSVSELTRKFGEFLNIGSSNELNTIWMGLALKRLGLVIDKKRKNRGIEVKINYEKARNKMKMFKSE